MSSKILPIDKPNRLGYNLYQDKETDMDTRMHQYNNTKNGGRERVFRNGNHYYISSDWGNGFSGKREVSRPDMISCLEFTGAPQNIINSILSD
jgi:hypothetical protein